MDIYPTLLELCGITQPRLKHPLQGKSLVETLMEGAPIGRSFTISENWSQSTIITDQYKLGVWQKPADGKHPDFRAFGNMLFDLKNDPDEIVNIGRICQLGESSIANNSSNLPLTHASVSHS